MLLSLDISTSCTGWAIWDAKRKLIAAGAIETKTTTKKDKARFTNHFAKMDYVVEEIVRIIAKHGVTIERLSAEAALKKFSGGKTTANTMAALIGFNFCLCYTLTRRLKCKETMLDVRAARRMLSITIPKGAKDKKKYVIAKIQPMYPNLAWDKKKTGRLKDWCGDMADAIVIGLATPK